MDSSNNRLFFQQNGMDKEIDADHILVAAGWKPGTSGFGFEEVRVELDPNGTMKVDSCLQSSIPNIYACGDVAGPYQFTRMAGYQAWYATVNTLFSPFKKFAVDYFVVLLLPH